MKKESKEGPRLNTKNFMRTNSDAIRSIDYDPKSKILEVEFRDENKIYHYLKVEKSIWKKFSIKSKPKNLWAHI